MSEWWWIPPLAIGLAAFGFVVDRIEKKLDRIIGLLVDIKIGRRDL